MNIISSNAHLKMIFFQKTCQRTDILMCFLTKARNMQLNYMHAGLSTEEGVSEKGSK